jgi:NTP pyrophosphatase (non-canonical NTP hydrolase)
MPTYSSAISDNDFTEPQKPTPQLKRPNRPREFWDVEPGDAGTEGWRDDPDDPTGAQLGSVANTNPNPTPPKVTDPTTVQPQQAPPAAKPPVTITPDTPAPVKSRVDNPKWLEYLRFVDTVTSDESKIASQFIARTAQLQAEGCKLERLLTAAVGISAEGGEFLEIVKKITFQGKPYDEASINHLKIELGDVLWYVAQACMALDVSLDDVIAQNITKLAARYPEGHFDSYFSENRRIDDL